MPPKAAGASALIMLATGLDFFWGPGVTAGLHGQGADWFQALAAGFLLHVVLRQTGAKIGNLVPAGTGRQKWFSGVGSLLGAGLLAILFQIEHFPHAAAGERIVSTFFQLALKGAPALLIAYLVAGFMSSLLTRSSIVWMRRGRQWKQAMRGMPVGLPFPICSCGVVPLYRTLVRSGAPATAAMAFLNSTPELGLDAVFLSISLQGGQDDHRPRRGRRFGGPGLPDQCDPAPSSGHGTGGSRDRLSLEPGTSLPDPAGRSVHVLAAEAGRQGIRRRDLAKGAPRLNQAFDSGLEGLARGPGLEPGSAAPKAAVLPIGRPPKRDRPILAAAGFSRHGIRSGVDWGGDEKGTEDVHRPG